MKTILWTVSLLLVICGCTPKPTEVVSPDGHIRLQFALDDHNRMTYRIDVDDTAFVAPSALGFLAGKGVNLSEGMKVSVRSFPLRTRHGHNLGERIRVSVTIIMKWRFVCLMRRIRN